jgi:hypothetical protein
MEENDREKTIVGFVTDFNLKIASVGARGVVHMPQFNGKQEGAPTGSSPHLRCPRNGQADESFAIRLPVTQPLDALNKRLGRRPASCSASPDTGQQGGLA